MDTLTLKPIARVNGTVRLPGSKSISNRALLLAAMATGTTRITNLLHSDDTRYMLAALRQLGVEIAEVADAISVAGRAGPLCTTDQAYELYLGMAGTAYRPLTAALCLGRGHFRLLGNARMSERPIGDLVTPLLALGANIRYLDRPGYPPVEVVGTGLNGGRVAMSGSVSSQFLTSLLMAAPLARGPVTVAISGEQVSKPYLDITLDLMRRFGVTATHEDHRLFAVPRGRYVSPGALLIEGDASNATYFLAAGAIAGSIRVEGIGASSIQGDTAFVEVLRAMGASVDMGADYISVSSAPLQAVDLDLNAIPDAAMTVAVLALFAAGTTRIRNVGNWRVKETDRLAAMAHELRKLGAKVVEGEDSLTITPPATIRSAEIETYDDHRMAMCFALVALGGVAVTIRDPNCVAKTFPEFFSMFESVCQ
jgi:3-phosphoshikimate 1-carboxyvinyltransferase